MTGIGIALFRAARLAFAMALVGSGAIAQEAHLPAAPSPAFLAPAASATPGAQIGSPSGARLQPAATMGPTLTRKQAEAMALRQNPRITVNHLLSLAQQQVVRERRSAELPQITGSITAEDGYDGSRIASGALSASRLLEHAGGGVNASQLITDFGRIHNLVSSSKLELQAQREREQATREAVVFVADQAFYGALQAQAVRRVAEQTVATRQATQRQVGQLTKHNLRSTLDQSFATVDVAQAELLLLDARNNADAAMAALDAVLGLDHAQTYTLLNDAGAPAVPPPDVDVLITMALRQRPDLLALHSTSESEHKLSRAQADQRLPTLSAIGTVGGTPVRSGRYFVSSWDGAAAANLNVPIFNGFLFSAQAKEADLRARATEAQASELRDTIVRDVRSGWLEAQNSFARIAVTEQLLGAANQSLRLAQARYNLGLSSIVELTEAQLAQTQADIAHADAEYRYRLALAALHFQTGQQQ